MGFSYQMSDPRGTYFVTFATVQWPRRPRYVFSRKRYIDIFLEIIKYCQKEKGLQIHAWRLMRNAARRIISI
jgi:putative transposase